VCVCVCVPAESWLSVSVYAPHSLRLSMCVYVCVCVPTESWLSVSAWANEACTSGFVSTEMPAMLYRVHIGIYVFVAHMLMCVCVRVC